MPFQWEEFKYNKPKVDINNPDDEAAYNEATETIGDYKLKSSPDYTVPKHLRESTLKKYKQLLETRERQYFLRHNFNNKVFTMRRKKEQLKTYLREGRTLLEDIRGEIPQEAHEKPPDMPAEHEEEYMERNLEVIMTLPEEPSRPSSSQSERVSHVKAPDADYLEKEVLSKDSAESNEVALSTSKINEIKSILEMDFSKPSTDKETPWECESRVCRLNRKLFQQKTTIRDMNESIKDFDQSLEHLNTGYVEASLKANLLDLHILTLHHELLILREFESVEEQLSFKVNSTIQELIDIDQPISSLKNSIEEHKSAMQELQVKEKEIQDHFLTVVQNNKFYDFLRRIFRKRYRPPKLDTDGKTF